MGQATEKMREFVQVLLAERDWEQEQVLAIAPSREHVAEFDVARSLINYLKSRPKRAGQSGAGAGRPPVVEAGMYKQGDRIFKVQQAIHGSGNLYAKELVRHGDSFSFEYARGAIRRLSAEDKMSLEEAKEFGVLYGTCCVCGRVLTKESSIEAGIGPICAQKF